MNKIKILSPQEAQKIAAGEVVERPANIIKEIIENSIDAQATQISLSVEKAGQNLIQITDNGCGMTQEDAKLCFHPHATSKINNLDDLTTISSFGFRGEALASISAVSKVTLITKVNIQDQTTDDLGTKLEYLNGQFIKIEKIACPQGTQLIIKDLFYNTPVRKKFLKREETEWNQIQQVFYSFCLSNIKIHFKFFKDNKLILNAPPVENLKDRASQIWGHNFSQNLIILEKNVQQNLKQKNVINFKISGLISNHNFSRYGRQQIFFFTNNRWIKNQELSKALLKGYLNVLPPAKFPAAFIFIEIENDQVDINVHPKKEEVRFIRPKTIENRLQLLVQQTLENNLTKSLQPKTSQEPTYSEYQEATTIKASSELKTDTLPEFSRKLSSTKPNILSTLLNQNPFEQKASFVHPELCRRVENKPIETTISYQNKIIGQLFQTYILIESQDEFIIIDQHAAHERILYEKFLKNFEKKEGTKLMFPEIINLKPNHLKHILNEKEFLSNQGICIEQFGENQIAIKTSPPKIQNHSLKEFILEMAEFIDENEQLEKEQFRKKLNEHMHSQLACKMAIKAGDTLSFEQMQQLIDDLQKTTNRLVCVHGRPTNWVISKYQVEKNFKRK